MNVFESVVCEMAAILSSGWVGVCVCVCVCGGGGGGE